MPRKRRQNPPPRTPAEELQPLPAFFDVPLGNGWIASVRFVPDADMNPIIGELRIYPEDGATVAPGEWNGAPESVPGVGVTARLIRSGLRLGDVERQARKKLREHPAWWTDFDHWELTDIAVGRRRTNHRTGSQAATARDRLLALVAKHYVDAVDADSRSPVVDATKTLTAEQLFYTREHVRDMLGEARRRGLLTRAQHGRAGGRLTPKAEALLATDDGGR